MSWWGKSAQAARTKQGARIEDLFDPQRLRVEEAIQLLAEAGARGDALGRTAGADRVRELVEALEIRAELELDALSDGELQAGQVAAAQTARVLELNALRTADLVRDAGVISRALMLLEPGPLRAAAWRADAEATLQAPALMEPLVVRLGAGGAPQASQILRGLRSAATMAASVLERVELLAQDARLEDASLLSSLAAAQVECGELLDELVDAVFLPVLEQELPEDGAGKRAKAGRAGAQRANAILALEDALSAHPLRGAAADFLDPAAQVGGDDPCVSPVAIAQWWQAQRTQQVQRANEAHPAQRSES